MITYSYAEMRESIRVHRAKQARVAASVNDTELDQVISNIPWADAYTFGAGVNVVTGATAGTAVNPFEPVKRTVKSSTERYRFVQNDSELNQEVEASTSGKYNTAKVVVTGSASYLSKIKFSELYITLVAEYQSTYDGYDEVGSYSLNPDALKLIGDPPKFRAAYGDYFVAGGRRGSRFLGVYVCKSSSVSSMQEFKASFGVEAPNVFSAEGSTRFMQAASKNNIEISCSLFMEGYQGTPPDGPWTPEKIMSALAWFKQNEQGIDLKAKLKHYSTIVPTYPRNIPISPDIFVELSVLYVGVWDIRSMYGSCPAYYQNQLRNEYIALDTGVVANQNILATDAAKRKEYQEKTDILYLKLRDIFDRMDFYFKAQATVGHEPAKDQHIEEGVGQQSWLYGFSTYPKSNAVVIQSRSMHYAEDWHIGWREKTLEFGPDQNYLLVGWQVISNWTDGTNGQWWKTVDQIIMKNHGAVHVKSQYDRGCNWTVNYYFVDAKDYQFQ